MGKRTRVVGAVLALIVAVLAMHNVPDAATEEDREYGNRILAAAGYEGAKRDFGDLTVFDNQVRAIQAVQDAAISIAKLDEEISQGSEREPRNVFEQKKGLCYDRSRAIEKMLAALGFEVRHVAIYATVARGTIAAVLTPGNDSHALTEVSTSKGWMLVEPNVPWIGLTADGRTVDAAALRSIDMADARWAPGVTGKPHPIFSNAYAYVRGLYSRHGGFYPPYTPIPDVNWRQLVQNFGGWVR